MLKVEEKIAHKIMYDMIDEIKAANHIVSHNFIDSRPDIIISIYITMVNSPTLGTFHPPVWLHLKNKNCELYWQIGTCEHTCVSLSDPICTEKVLGLVGHCNMAMCENCKFIQEEK